MQQNEMQKQRESLFGEFLDVTFQLSEEELQAIHGLIPMTQEIFNRCAGKCEEIGGVRELEELRAERKSEKRWNKTWLEKIKCSCYYFREMNLEEMKEDSGLRNSRAAA